MSRGNPHSWRRFLAVGLLLLLSRIAHSEPEELLTMPSDGEPDVTVSTPTSPESVRVPNEAPPHPLSAYPRSTPSRKLRRLASVERVRQPTAIDGSSEQSVTAPRGEPPYHLGFALFGGASTLTSGGGFNLGAPSAKYNYALAAPLDFRSRYWGIELEGHYGNASLNQSAVTETYQAYGFNGAIKGQLPFTTGRVKWVPKIGIGYAYLGETDNQVGSSNGANAGASLAVNGAFGLVGLDLDFYDRVLVWADFAFSFYGSGTLTFSGAVSQITGTQPYTSSSASFQRWRAAAAYRFTPWFLAGLEFIQRSVGMSNSAGFASTLPLLYAPQNQYGLLVMLQF
jgi:hypothetical protein